MAENFGFLSVLPPLVAIVLAIATRQVYASMFIAIWLGATFLNGYNPWLGLLRSMDTYVINSVADPWYAEVLIFTMMIAAMVALMTRSGGANAIAEALGRRAKTPRAGQLCAWAIGMIIFFCDYTSALITGNTARPLTDRLRISREKLSYIVDSTAAPVATMALISTWIGYELGIIGEAFAKIGIESSPYSIFLQSIPYRFYSIFALSLVVIIAVTMRDFGPMYNAEIRARTTGKVLRDGAVPLAAGDTAEMMPKEGIPYRAVNFIVPIAFLIISTFIGLYWHGVNVGGADPNNILEAIGASDSVLVLIWTSLLSAIVTLIMIVAQRLLSFVEAFDTLMAGAKSVFAALVILVFAWALSAVTGELGADSYLVGLVTAAKVPYQLLPLIIFLISCLMAFAMGTSWGTMGIVTPLAIPVANAVAPHLLIPTLASVLTGAIFGDHCSPISDTTILSSTGAGSDHIDHVRTQMPYALLGAAVAGIFGFIPAGFGVPVWISIILGIAALIVFVRFVGKSTNVDLKVVETGGQKVEA